MMSPQEFITQTINKKQNVDKAYGAQCWDYFAYMEKLAGYPITYCSTSGYVKDIWNDRKKNGVLNYFSEVSSDRLQLGDWIIWGVSPYGTGNSHIAMFVNYEGSKVKVIGQNQDSTQNAIYATLTTAGLSGCLRPMCWNKKAFLINKVGLLQKAINADNKGNLAVDNRCGPLMQAQMKKIRITLNGSQSSVRNIIKFVQQQFDGLTIDGKYGAATQKKVIAYQKANKLIANGVIEYTTLMAFIK